MRNLRRYLPLLSYTGQRGWPGRQVTGRALLVLAVLVGIVLRFYRLDEVSMTGDEGFAWAAAAQPVSRLLQLQPIVDSGKLAVYDLLLHYWITFFGDGLRSMRGLSAAIDTISIVMMFAMVRELYRVFADQALSTGELAGGFAALMFATNATIVQSARAARMYPLMTAAALGEMLFFVRAQRSGRFRDNSLTAFFLALAIAANFTAALILVGQAVWLAYLVIARSRKLPGATLHLVGPALSLVAGLTLLLPWRRAATSLMREGMRNRDFGWIPYQPPIRWSYEVLRVSTRNEWLFWLLLVLAAFAIWRHSSKTPLAPMFLVTGIAGPFAAVAIASMWGVPMMVDRYVVIAVVGFLGLAAMGAASFESKFVQIVIFGLIAGSVRPDRPPTVDWRHAAALASTASMANAEIGVVPVFALDVVRYHLPPEQRSLAIGLKSECGEPHVLIVSPGSISPPFMSVLKACYPRLLGKDEFLEIRSR
jgi:hypothetical protein